MSPPPKTLAARRAPRLFRPERRTDIRRPARAAGVRLPDLRIVADERERKCGIPALLREAGLGLEVRTLPVGDYIVGPEAAVERKSVHDLVSSVFDGRLFDQCARLRANFALPLIAVEGNPDEVEAVAENPLVFYGAVSRVAIDYRIPIVPTPSASHTARLLVALAARCAEARAGSAGAGDAPPIPSGPYVKKIKKRDDTEGQQLSALASLPGIGEKLAVRLLGRFGTPLAALNAPLADLAKVDGLGAARARRIRHVLESTSRHHGADGGQRTLHDG